MRNEACAGFRLLPGETDESEDVGIRLWGGKWMSYKIE